MEPLLFWHRSHYRSSSLPSLLFPILLCLCCLSTLSSVTEPASWSMDELHKLGISTNCSKRELINNLSHLPVPSLKSIRSALFSSAISKGLCTPSCILVNRKDTPSNPIHSKLSSDIWTLIDCTRNETIVPRTLLRNGKRNRATFEASQVSDISSSVDSAAIVQEPQDTQAHIDSPSQVTQDHANTSPLNAQAQANTPPMSSEIFALRTIRKDVNKVMNDLRDLKRSISVISRTQSSDTALRNEVASLRQAVLKLSSERSTPSNTASDSPNTNSLGSYAGTSRRCESPYTTVGISAWNCCGLSQAIPYSQLLAENSDIIILTEHWLWPYDLSKLDSVISGCKGSGVSDSRLNEDCSLRRGCGGVGILWKQQLPVSVLYTDSARIFAVQLTGPFYLFLTFNRGSVPTHN